MYTNTLLNNVCKSFCLKHEQLCGGRNNYANNGVEHFYKCPPGVDLNFLLWGKSRMRTIFCTVVRKHLECCHTCLEQRLLLLPTAVICQLQHHRPSTFHLDWSCSEQPSNRSSDPLDESHEVKDPWVMLERLVVPLFTSHREFFTGRPR